MFPNDAINYRTDLTTNATTTLFTVPAQETYTILYVSMNSDSVAVMAKMELDCTGGARILKVNNLKSVQSIERFKYTKCFNDTVTAHTSGLSAGDQVTVSIIYAPYDMKLSTFNSTTTNIALLPTPVAFSHNEILFTVMIFIVLLAIPFLRMLFTGYNKRK